MEVKNHSLRRKIDYLFLISTNAKYKLVSVFCLFLTASVFSKRESQGKRTSSWAPTPQFQNWFRSPWARQGGKHTSRRPETNVEGATWPRVPHASPRCPWKQRPAGEAAPGPRGLQFRPPVPPPPRPRDPQNRRAGSAPRLPTRPRTTSPGATQPQASRRGSALLPQAAKASRGASAAAASSRPAPQAPAWTEAALLSHLRSHHHDLRQLDDVGAHRIEDVLEFVNNRN